MRAFGLTLTAAGKMTALLLFILLLVSACGESKKTSTSPASITVQQGAFVVQVSAEGELSAENSVPLTLPAGNVMPRTIVWLAEDGKWVEKGEVVARFDRSIAERSLNEVLMKLEKSDLDIEAKKREFTLALNKITADLLVTREELGVAERFSIEAGSIAMSRQEMIERLQDEGFLRIKQDHYRQRQSGQEDRRHAELAVLGAQRESASSKGDLFQQQIDASVTEAPNSGYFVRRKNWYGESLSAGQSVFPGNAFGEIPDLGKMQAVLQVLESEAGSVVVRKKVVVFIDAFPQQPLTGTIGSMAQVPASLERDSPIKYFAVNVTLDQSDPDWITPGARVRGEIQILEKENVLTVPNQAIEQSRDGENPRMWVYIKRGNSEEKRFIDIGERGPLRTEVTDGLKVGDEVLLVRPVSATGAMES